MTNDKIQMTKLEMDMKKSICLMLAILLATASVSGCGRGKDKKDIAKDEAIPVKVVKVKLQDLEKKLEYVGNIKGRDEAVLYPKVSGKIIEKAKDEGSRVTKGEAVCYVDRDEVGLKFEKAPVESTLFGIIGRIYVDIGSSVTPQTPIALIADMDKAEIDLDIPEKYLPKIMVGQEADIMVDAYPDEVFKGKVSMISPAVDLQTRTAPTEITIDNPYHRLQTGMFAHVELIIEKDKSVPIVMKESIIGRDPDTYVYVVDGKRAFMRKVVIGIRQGPYYEIREGLREGELVVIMGQQRLKDGAVVSVEE